MALRGFDVRAMMPGKDDWPLIGRRLDAATALLERYAPARLEMFRRDIKRIWVTGIPSRATFVREHGMCVLNFDFVTDESTRDEEIALTLVHEGTHARLARAGFGYGEKIRPRIERLCLGSELVVARRLPLADDLVEETLRCLAWDDATWSNEALREDQIQALRDLGWFGKVGYWIGRAARLSLRVHANTR
jgi:hypothetical protein